MNTQIQIPSRCEATANGIHRAGDRCDTCYHVHCLPCGTCPLCERNDDITCKSSKTFVGDQGRLRPNGERRQIGGGRRRG